MISCRCLILCLVGIFVLDTIFFHYLIQWGRDSLNRRQIRLAVIDDVELNTDRSDQISSNADVRSRATFWGQFPLTIKGSVGKPTIPKIIHQTWDTEDIPETFHRWIVTWKRLHPDWSYWFWTLKEIRRFVAKEYPEFLNLYDLYTEDIFRSDVMRYLVLYKYGGIYVDLDMEALKPLDIWTHNFNCIVSEETYEHPFVVREADPPANIVNGFIACRPGHPFLKSAIDSLEEFAGFYFGDYLHATGPFFLDAVLERYLIKMQNASHMRSDSVDITIVPPKYFFPTYDPSESDLITGRCFPGAYQLLKEPAKITCKELLKTFLRRTPGVDSYTDHHWVHAYMFHPDWKKKNTKLITEIVPSAITKHV